jgi:hypothetical protein
MKSTFLIHWLFRLTAALLLSLLTIASFAEESRPLWKVAVFRAGAPLAIEMEQGIKDNLVKLGYVEGQNLTYLPTVIVKARIEDFGDPPRLPGEFSAIHRFSELLPVG